MHRDWSLESHIYLAYLSQSEPALLLFDLWNNMLVCLCLLGSNLNGHANAENTGYQEVQLAFKPLLYSQQKLQ
jgi:hypothetical protein